MLDAVLSDLQQPTALELAIGWTSEDGDDRGTLWFQEVASAPEMTGVHVRRAEPADLMVHLAEQLQEQFFPETSGAWAEARPVCPGHRHPAEPRVVRSIACWVCPSTDQLLGRIGAIAS